MSADIAQTWTIEYWVLQSPVQRMVCGPWILWYSEYNPTGKCYNEQVVWKAWYSNKCNKDGHLPIRLYSNDPIVESLIKEIVNCDPNTLRGSGIPSCSKFELWHRHHSWVVVSYDSREFRVPIKGFVSTLISIHAWIRMSYSTKYELYAYSAVPLVLNGVQHCHEAL